MKGLVLFVTEHILAKTFLIMFFPTAVVFVMKERLMT